MVGRGSFGKVYLVKKKDKMDQPLALKVLAKDVVSKRNLMIKTQGKSPNRNLQILSYLLISGEGHIRKDQQSIYSQASLRLLD